MEARCWLPGKNLLLIVQRIQKPKLPCSLSADSGASTPGSGVFQESFGQRSATPVARLSIPTIGTSVTTARRSGLTSTRIASAMPSCSMSSGRATIRPFRTGAGSIAMSSSLSQRNRNRWPGIRGASWQPVRGGVSLAKSNQPDRFTRPRIITRNIYCERPIRSSPNCNGIIRMNGS